MRVVKAESPMIFLGYKGENMAREVHFPLDNFRNDGEGFHVDILKPFSDEKYERTVRVSGNDAIWDVEDADVDILGIGKVQLVHTGADFVEKSEIFQTRIAHSLEVDEVTV